jgi:class 3 adenylate cyclase
VAAINRGDRVTATAIAGQVLAVDENNADAEDLLASPGDEGEIRRLTILFADLVDSTVLSTRVEPETYRLLVGRYRDLVLGIVNRFEGHVGSTKGDGLLVVFGHPKAHENDVRCAVLAGLEITRAVERLSEQAKRRFGSHRSVGRAVCRAYRSSHAPTGRTGPRRRRSGRCGTPTWPEAAATLRSPRLSLGSVSGH